MFKKTFITLGLLAAIVVGYFVVEKYYIKREDKKVEETNKPEIKDSKSASSDTKSVETKPQETKPVETKPEDTEPEVTKPEGNKPDELKSNEAEHGSSNTNGSSGYEEIPFNKDEPFKHLKTSDDKIENEDELISNLPPILQESVRKYPETKNEILQYEQLKDKPESYDITGVYQKGDIPRFIQWDSRWGFEHIGSSYIAHSACGPVALSSIYIHFTGDTSKNPVVMSKWAAERGYYSDGYGSGWGLWDDGARELGLETASFDFNMDEIRSRLDRGSLIVLNVGPGDFTKGGHYIMLIGYTPEGELIIHDVNSPENSSKNWSFERIEPQVKNAWSVSN